MKQDFISQNNRIILSHLKLTWKLVLFFTIFLLLSALSMLGFTVIFNNDPLGVPWIGTITKGELVYNPGNGNSWDYYSQSDSMTLATFLPNVILGLPMIVFFSIILMSLIGLVFLKELKQGQISIWSTLSISRNQIFFSKFLFIVFAISIIYIPTFLTINIFGSISKDAADYFGLVFWQSVNFYIFILFLTSIYCLLAMALSEYQPVVFILISLFCVYMIVCFFLGFIGNLEEDPKHWMKKVKYVSVLSLLPNHLSFDKNTEGIKISMKVEDTLFEVIRYPLIKVKSWWSVFTTFILIGVSFPCTYLTSLIFKNKDLQI